MTECTDAKSGRERPPSLSQCIAQGAFTRGRSRPDGEPRFPRTFWPSAGVVERPTTLSLATVLRTLLEGRSPRAARFAAASMSRAPYVPRRPGEVFLAVIEARRPLT